jgi:hypothetical protein
LDYWLTIGEKFSADESAWTWTSLFGSRFYAAVSSSGERSASHERAGWRLQHDLRISLRIDCRDALWIDISVE